MDNPFICDLPTCEQIKNVLQCMRDAEMTLMLDYGKTGFDADRLMESTISTSLKFRQPWYNAAYTYVSARQQWIELLAQEENERQVAEKARRAALVAACPFKAGDRVARRDGTIGVVQYVFFQSAIGGQRKEAVKVAVDWPAPQRIGGDGWHRSTVNASALKAVK